MKITVTLTLALLSNLIYAQQETEVYVFDLQKSGNSYSISNPWNAKYKNPGYDNQPHFLADGKSMYYVSTNMVRLM
ncbi:MAG: hypothetical protein AAGA02_16710 [Bacteroidota bacterium]